MNYCRFNRCNIAAVVLSEGNKILLNSYTKSALSGWCADNNTCPYESNSPRPDTNGLMVSAICGSLLCIDDKEGC